jgi:hypothetical protein
LKKRTKKLLIFQKQYPDHGVDSLGRARKQKFFGSFFVTAQVVVLDQAA